MQRTDGGMAVEIHTKVVENGILSLEEVTLAASATLTEMEHLYA